MTFQHETLCRRQAIMLAFTFPGCLARKVPAFYDDTRLQPIGSIVANDLLFGHPNLTLPIDSGGWSYRRMDTAMCEKDTTLPQWSLSSLTQSSKKCQWVHYQEATVSCSWLPRKVALKFIWRVMQLCIRSALLCPLETGKTSRFHESIIWWWFWRRNAHRGRHPDRPTITNYAWVSFAVAVITIIVRPKAGLLSLL